MSEVPRLVVRVECPVPIAELQIKEGTGFIRSPLAFTSYASIRFATNRHTHYSSFVGPTPSIQSLKKFITCCLVSLFASSA